MTIPIRFEVPVRAIAAAGLMAGLLAGCAAPNLGARPEPLAPAAIAASRSLAGTAGAEWPGEGWWKAYGDPQLDALIAEGLSASPDVAAASARFARAAALARVSGAARLPTLDASGKVGLEKQSLNMGFPPEFQAFLPQGWNDSGQLAAQFGFDLDLWGKNRAAYAAATSDMRAAALDARQARLMLAAGIASAYADLARLFAERDLRARQLEVATSSRALLAQREASGLENRGGVAVSEGEVANARIALSQAEESLALRRNQLAALVGAGPDRGLAIEAPRLAPAALRTLPEDVTINLVGRRADLVAARQRVESAASRIKVARADFYPAVRLNALFGVQSLGLGLLFDKNSEFGSVGPAVSLPIFHGGEIKGRYESARADYDAAVAAYDSAVLGAYQQTADALTTARMATARLGDARTALAAAQEGYDVITRRYKAGLATSLDVLQVEDRLIQARLGAAALETIVRTADIALARALGGGFAPSPVTGATTSEETTHG